jgi:NAD+ kinase
MVVFVENSVMDEQLLLANSSFQSVKDKLMTFQDSKDDLTDKIDFIVCLGGDGTLLYASLLFQVSYSLFFRSYLLPFIVCI